MSRRPRETGRFLTDLEFLGEVTRETLSSLELDDILRRVVTLLRRRFGYHYAAVGLVVEGAVVFRAGSWGELSGGDAEDATAGEHGWRIPVGKGLVGTAVATARPRLVNRVEADPDYIEATFLPQTRAELSVPMMHRGEVLGVLDVQSDQEGAFDDEDVQVLQIVGALVAPAVHIARMVDAERRRARHLRLVGEIAQLVMVCFDRATIVQVACQAIRESLGVACVSIGLLDPEHRVVVHVGQNARLPLLRNAPRESRLGSGVMGQVAQTGQSLRLDDVTLVPDVRPSVPGTRSVIGAPLRVREGIMGAVTVEHTEPHAFTTEDEALLTSLAAYIAQATENAQLFEGQRRRWQQLLVINEVTRIVTQTGELQQILDLVAREVHDRFGYFATVSALVEEGELELRAVSCDEPLDLAPGHREPLEGGVAGQVVRTGEVVHLRRAGEGALGSSALRGDMQSALAVPLTAGREIIGVLEAQSPEPDAFDADDRLVMETLAKSVAGAVANARAVKQVQQLREDMANMVVHDLRSPVQGILHSIDTVRGTEGVAGDPETLRRLDEGRHNATRILLRVNSLLDVARFEAGSAQLRLTPAVLNDHLRSAARAQELGFSGRSVEVVLDLSPDVPVLWFDQELMARTLDNLLGNALKFAPTGGRVTLRTEVVDTPLPGCPTEPPMVVVSVADNGEGIPASYHDKIFEKFGQVETRKAGIRMSSGLGLALCRYVVEAHHGAIWVESAPGQGATFRFSLPTQRPKA